MPPLLSGSQLHALPAGLVPLVRLGGVHRAELVVPELLQEGAHFRHALRHGVVEPPRPLPPLGDEAGALEDAQVLRDGRTRDGEMRCDLPCRQLVSPDQAEDRPASRLGDGVYGLVHRRYVSRR
jgi:hypothetical protein